MTRRFSRGLFALPLLLSLACATDAPVAVDSGVADAATRAVEAVDVGGQGGAAPTPVDALAPAYDDAELVALIDRLSETDGEFFSDNFISNETSYLQIADDLPEIVPPGGVYLGVGPEQNFTYLALTRPELAFIVDIRRDNMILHLLYKAAFELAEDREQFLALLTGRPLPEADDGESNIEAILDAVAALPHDDASYEAAHRQLTERIERLGMKLGARDRRSLARAHRAFFDGGVDIRFSLKEQSFRKYPSLRELVVARSPKGEALGFLASAELFARVQRMQRENRIIPLVGNFAGDRTLPELGKLLAKEERVVRTFYVSNVEQYLMVDGLWWKWKRNIEALPSDDDSVFIRCYLDQGRPHPDQMKGHRTATVLQRIADFNARERPYASMLALASDRLVAR